MSELPPDDPFSERDPAAAEREQRRLEREARRRARSEKSQRSLADRVKGGGDEPAPDPPPPAEPEAEAEPPADLEPEADLFADPPPATEAEPIPERSRWDGVPVGGDGGGSGSHRIAVRRGLAAGAVIAVGLVLVLLVKALGDGSEPAPVAVEEPIETIDVVVPEGLTIEQIAKVAKKAKLKGSYTKAAKQAEKNFPLKKYDAKDAPSLEGFLFPATYELEKGAKAKDLVAKQLEAFEQNFGGVNTKAAQQKNLTDYDVLIIASMIEEEVQVAEERPKVAAVIYNRLAEGDTLGIDATLRYELGKYDGQLLQSELDAPTPYNSRLTPGLPPTPIANPGLASIEAAASPAKTDAYFFVIKPGTCGEHVFTADSAEFEAAQARYQEALAAEGGSPTDCS